MGHVSPSGLASPLSCLQGRLEVMLSLPSFRLVPGSRLSGGRGGQEEAEGLLPARPSGRVESDCDPHHLPKVLPPARLLSAHPGGTIGRAGRRIPAE